MEDSAIIDLYWAREERALSETDAKYGGYCRSIAHNILKNREDSEECVSDTWLHAWNAMPLQRPSILSSFLGRITRNLSFDRCRRQNAEKRGGGSLPLALDELSECVPAPGRVEQALEARELAEAIDRFLRTLPERECSIFLRRYWYFDTIAAICRDPLVQAVLRELDESQLPRLKRVLHWAIQHHCALFLYGAFRLR